MPFVGNYPSVKDVVNPSTQVWSPNEPGTIGRWVTSGGSEQFTSNPFAINYAGSSVAVVTLEANPSAFALPPRLQCGIEVVSLIRGRATTVDVVQWMPGDASLYLEYRVVGSRFWIELGTSDAQLANCIIQPTISVMSM